MSSLFAVETKNLKKIYDGKPVIKDVSLQISRGLCFGVLGPTGAGKSTLLRMIYGATTPSFGDLFVLGLPAQKAGQELKKRLGVAPQEDGLDPGFTVLENLTLFTKFFALDPLINKQRIKEVLYLMRLDEMSEQLVRDLSPGFRRRLSIARAMVTKPELLILDEPSSGLDAQGRASLWTTLQQIKADMGTVILSSQYIEEIERVCDQVIILHQGKVMAIGSPDELIRKWIGHEIVEFESNGRDLPYDIQHIQNRGLEYQVFDQRIRVYIKEKFSGREILSLLQTPGVALRQPNLDDVFCRVTGHELQEVSQ